MGIEELEKERVENIEECNLCKESKARVGEKTEYGALVIFRIGEKENGLFATLSPKTGGREEDFSIQLMPFAHLTHFCQIEQYPKLAENYGTAFAKLSNAMTRIIAEENKAFNPTADSREESVSVGTYGKCTNWHEKKEHLHIKIFPFRGNIGQPYTVDSSFGRKEVFNQGGKSFVKMDPVTKVPISKKRLAFLSERLVQILEAKK